jgi:hypothetical protein
VTFIGESSRTLTIAKLSVALNTEEDREAIVDKLRSISEDRLGNEIFRFIVVYGLEQTEEQEISFSEGGSFLDLSSPQAEGEEELDHESDDDDDFISRRLSNVLNNSQLHRTAELDSDDEEYLGIGRFSKVKKTEITTNDVTGRRIEGLRRSLDYESDSDVEDSFTGRVLRDWSRPVEDVPTKPSVFEIIQTSVAIKTYSSQEVQTERVEDSVCVAVVAQENPIETEVESCGSWETATDVSDCSEASTQSEYSVGIVRSAMGLTRTDREEFCQYDADELERLANKGTVCYSFLNPDEVAEGKERVVDRHVTFSRREIPEISFFPEEEEINRIVEKDDIDFPPLVREEKASRAKEHGKKKSCLKKKGTEKPTKTRELPEVAKFLPSYNSRSIQYLDKVSRERRAAEKKKKTGVEARPLKIRMVDHATFVSIYRRYLTSIHSSVDVGFAIDYVDRGGEGIASSAFFRKVPGLVLPQPIYRSTWIRGSTARPFIGRSSFRRELCSLRIQSKSGRKMIKKVYI